MATQNAKKILKQKINYASSAIECLKNADCAILVTEWNEFKHLDMARIKQAMRQPILIDGRNIYDVHEMKNLGFTYRGMGRGY